MSKNRWFKFYASDFVAGIRSLTPIEVTAYIVVLCELYDHEGTCKRDDEHFARACLIRKADLSRAIDGLIAKGKLTCEAGMLTNKRVSEEIGKRTVASLSKAQQRHDDDPTKARSRHEAGKRYNKNNGPGRDVQGYKEERIQNNTTLKVSALHPGRRAFEEGAQSRGVEGFIKRRELRARS